MLAFNKWIRSRLSITIRRTIHANVQNHTADYFTRHALKIISVIQKYANCSFDSAFLFYRANAPVLYAMSESSLVNNLLDSAGGIRLQLDAFKLNPIRVESEKKGMKHHKKLLKEYGLSLDVFDKTVGFQNIMMWSPQQLISFGILTVDPVKYILSSLQENVSKHISSHLNYDIYMNWPLTVIHEGLITLLLATQLDITKKMALLILQKHSLLKRRCVSEFSKALHMLLNDIEFERYELSADPRFLMSTEQLLSYYLHSSGLETRKIKERIKSNPLILSRNPDTVIELERIFRKHMITDEQLKDAAAYKLLPSKAAKHLKEIEEISDFKSLKCLPNYMSVVYRFDQVRENLNTLKAVGHSSWSINKLLKSSRKLEQYLINQQDRCNAVEATFLLASVLNHPVGNVKKQLKLHPRFTKVSYSNANLVVTRLLENGISKEQILYALPIVLYDVNLVMEIFSDMETYPELLPFEEWHTHIGFVSLLVYYIEKRTFFNFDGVLLTSTVNEDYLDIK